MSEPNFYENIHMSEIITDFHVGHPISKEAVAEAKHRFHLWFAVSVVNCWRYHVSQAEFLKAMERRGVVYVPMPPSVEEVDGEMVPCAGYIRWKKDGIVNSYVEERFCKAIAETLDKRSMAERARIMKEYFKKNNIHVSFVSGGNLEDINTEEDNFYGTEGQDQE